MADKKTGSRSFNAFSGVFVPTFLSIIGVILFLRLGFIVGGAGIGGAIIIILLAVSVTLSTGLSLSSIASNIRIGAGGAYSIITKTLGLEVGGSVGIPLFLAQTFSVGLYIFGFTEAWTFMFPEHDKLIVAFGAFLVLFMLVSVSTRIAVKVQIAVFALICLVLILIFIGANPIGRNISVPIINSVEGIPFWSLFAIFFPAVTGLMSGIGMSGELTDPKKQIPKGIISGLIFTTLIYIIMVLWIGYFATPGELLKNNLIIVELSALPFVTITGILAATFSSALTTLVAAPRVLQALAENKILPMSKVLEKKTSEGEPRNAVWVTSAIIIFLLFVGNLNSVAQILTIFFLITYAMINISVFIEQHLGLVSFRPIFRVPKFVSLYGAVSSFIMILLINVYAGVGAIIFIIFSYTILAQKVLNQKEGDVRSGLFRALSEWAAKKTTSLPKSKHVWKPNILVPVLTSRTLFGNFPLIKSILYPNGTMTVLGLKLTQNIKKNPEKEEITKKQIKKELKHLPILVKKFGEEEIFTSFSTIEAKNYVNAILVSLEAIESQTFPPNTLFLPFRPDKISKSVLKEIVKISKKEKVGTVIFDRDSELGLGSERDIHLWISPKAIKKDFYEDRYFDLAALVAYKIQRNWNGKIKIWMCVSKKKEREARKYLKKLVYEARLPTESTSFNVVNGKFKKTIQDAQDGDIHIIPFDESDIEAILKTTKIKNKSFLFVSDSTREDILT